MQGEGRAGPLRITDVRVSVLLALFALGTTGCSQSTWNSEIPHSPLLGIENGIWSFPTPRPPPSADAAPSASPSSEPSLGRRRRTIRMPKPYAEKPASYGEVVTRK
jgi:hypothetical protein